MENKNFSMVHNDNKIPFTAGYNLVSNDKLPQWFLKFRRNAFENYVKNFNDVKIDKLLLDFISNNEFSSNTFNILPSFEALLKYPMFNVESYTIVLVNGKYSSELSYEDELPFSVFTDGLNASIEDDEDFLEEKLRYQDNIFVSLNSAYLSNGIVIEIKDGEELLKPIHIVSIITTGSEKMFFMPRVFVKIGQNVKVDFIETSVSFNNEIYFENKVCEFFVGKNSCVNYYKFYNVSNKSCIVENCFFNLDESSFLNHVSFINNSGIIRGKNIFELFNKSVLNGVSSFNLVGESNVDIEFDLKHSSSDTKSDIKLFAVVDDISNISLKTAVDCKKNIENVETSQSSKILIASSKAKGVVKPFQMINSEKVKAFHGAVVSGVDVRDLFFLETRGIDKNQAKNLVLKSCLANILQNIHNNKLYDDFFKFIWL